MTERVLVVDDEPRICSVLQRYLTREGFQVDTAHDADGLRSRIAESRTDLVILDLNLGADDGLLLARELRATSNIPIVMLTGKVDTVDKIVGLEVGADDYITKPFDERELLARVRAVLRRAEMQESRSDEEPERVLLFGDWRLDLTAHELRTSDGPQVHLTSHEFMLLAAFARVPTRVLTRDEILEAIAGRDWSPNDRSVDVLVSKLRRKIEPDPDSPSFITTIRGVGYKFTTRVTVEKPTH